MTPDDQNNIDAPETQIEDQGDIPEQDDINVDAWGSGSPIGALRPKPHVEEEETAPAGGMAEKDRSNREAADNAEKEADEEPAPASTRQPKPKHEIPTEDEAFGEIEEEEEAPPESGEVASQRKPALGENGGTEAAVAPREQEAEKPQEMALRVVVEAIPAATPDVAGALAPRVVEIIPEITQCAPLRGDVIRFVDATRAPGPPTFGDLLDMSLALSGA